MVNLGMVPGIGRATEAFGTCLGQCEGRNFQCIAEGAMADPMVTAMCADPAHVSEGLFADACPSSGTEESAAAGC
jgi:hypothetical protein